MRRAFVLILLLGTSVLDAQETHQRLGVEKASDHEVRMGLDNFLAFSGASLASQLVPSLEYSWKKQWSVSGSWPWAFRYLVNEDGADQARWVSGSPALNLEWQSHSNGGRSSWGLGWNPAVEDDQLPRFLLSGQASLILDPVVLGSSFRFGTTLARRVEGTSWWQPFDLSLGLSLTEVLNSHVGWTLSLSPSVTTPWVSWPLESRFFPRFGLSLSVQVFYDQTVWNAKSGWAFDGSQTQWTNGVQWIPIH